MNARLSKSSYLRGLQCLKRLFLDRYYPELRDPLDPSTQAKFETGHQVGELARDLFPGGALAVDGHPSRVAQSLARTRRLIEDGAQVLYEPAFQHEGVLTYVDVLVRKGDKWRAFEVKSSTSVKDVYLHDAAIQYYILSGAGLELIDVSIVQLNPKYVRSGDLDLSQLFTVTSVHNEVRALQRSIPKRLQEMRAVLAGDDVPNIDIGPHCTDPYDCDFMGHCWAHVPEVSVFDIARLPRDRKFALYSQGIVRIDDIPAGFKMGPTSAFHVQQHRSGEVAVDQPAILNFVNSLTYPLHFLDFESINPAIPPFDGTSPYGKIPFQYSVHRVDAPGDHPKHFGHLADAGSDPRAPLVDSLLENIEDRGDVVVYNLSFEKSAISQLAEQLPAQASALRALLPRLKDLMTPFQRRHYYRPSMHGSYSIKRVLQVAAPELSYDGLSISDGDQAMTAFLGLQRQSDPDRIQETRNDLWEYCKLDTMAMVRILERLESLVGVSEAAKQ